MKSLCQIASRLEVKTWWQRLARRFIFGPLPAGADGWYIWRLGPGYPKHTWKCHEICSGIMVDTEPIDSYGAEWRVVEVEPHGEFRGPILPR